MYDEQKLIYWYPGLYLQPQHFQSIDLHHSYMLAQLRHSLHPWNFGFQECQINERALTEFLLKIDKFKVILPSGYYLEFPGNCIIPQIPLHDFIKNGTTSVKFWIALRKFDPRFPNVSDRNETKNATRWISSDHERTMRDVYTQGPETEVSRLYYNLRIISDDDLKNNSDCEVLPFIKLSLHNNKVSIDPKFSPPFLNTENSKALNNSISNIYDTICSCLSNLEEYKNAEFNGFNYRDNGDLIKLLLRCAFNRSLSTLEFFLNEKRTHPCDIYILIRQLICEISSFIANEDESDDLSKEKLNLHYNHFEQSECFDKLHIYLSSVLGCLSIDDNITFQLNKMPSGMFSACLDHNALACCNSVYLRLKSKMFTEKKGSDLDFIEIKASSESYIDTIIQHALPGLPLHFMDSIPSGLPNRNDTVWLKVGVVSDMWTKICDEKRISLFWPGAPKDLLAEVVFVTK